MRASRSRPPGTALVVVMIMMVVMIVVAAALRSALEASGEEIGCQLIDGGPGLACVDLDIVLGEQIEGALADAAGDDSMGALLL